MIYTYGYENNKPDGRLLNLASRNSLSRENALTGPMEAEAFENKEYLKLHMSTLKKVDIIESLFRKTKGAELKVNVSSIDMYGLTVP